MTNDLFFIDSHAHIDGPEYDEDRDEVIQRARDAGVSIILNVTSGDPNSGALEQTAELTSQYNQIYAALGVHPHEARLFDARVEDRINELRRSHPRVIAWGEIGLDYHYDNSPRDVQREVFRRQLRAAREAKLPVIIHTREAEDDTLAILRSEWSPQSAIPDWQSTTRNPQAPIHNPQSAIRNPQSIPGIMHCFSGSKELAAETLELGFFISFSGVVTFKKADALREVARAIPLDRLLIETDCPYLSPEPFRGRRNEPARVVEVARCLATLHGVGLEEIAKVTTQNFLRLFGLGLAVRSPPTP